MLLGLLRSSRLQASSHCKASSAEASLTFAASLCNSQQLQRSLHAAETPLKGWLLLCLYMATSWRLPADLRDIGSWIRICLQLIMVLGKEGMHLRSGSTVTHLAERASCATTCHSPPAGFYWYLSNPVPLPYIAHPAVQAAAWCTALAAAAVYRRSDMVNNAEIVCVAIWPALQSKAVHAASCSQQKGSASVRSFGLQSAVPNHICLTMERRPCRP